MAIVKKHHVSDLTAYFLKKGRKWWVESEVNKECFNSIEEMVAKHPVLLEIEAIKNSVDRRRLSREGDPVKVELVPFTEEKLIESEIDCYYCNGSGIAGALPCSNCDGTGTVKVTAKLS